eukprot:scaffold60659_cov57-Phaeocystis_antarctica.AAC.1
MRKHEPASSPSMKRVLHLEVPGHFSENHRSSTSWGNWHRCTTLGCDSRRIWRSVSSLSPKIERSQRVISSRILALLRLSSRYLNSSSGLRHSAKAFRTEAPRDATMSYSTLSSSPRASYCNLRIWSSVSSSLMMSRWYLATRVSFSLSSRPSDCARSVLSSVTWLGLGPGLGLGLGLGTGLGLGLGTGLGLGFVLSSVTVVSISRTARRSSTPCRGWSGRSSAGESASSCSRWPSWASSAIMRSSTPGRRRRKGSDHVQQPVQQRVEHLVLRRRLGDAEEQPSDGGGGRGGALVPHRVVEPRAPRQLEVREGEARALPASLAERRHALLVVARVSARKALSQPEHASVLPVGLLVVLVVIVRDHTQLILIGVGAQRRPRRSDTRERHDEREERGSPAEDPDAKHLEGAGALVGLHFLGHGARRPQHVLTHALRLREVAGDQRPTLLEGALQVVQPPPHLPKWVGGG